MQLKPAVLPHRMVLFDMEVETDPKSFELIALQVAYKAFVLLVL